MARTRRLNNGGSGRVGDRLSLKGEEGLIRCTYAAGVVMASQMFAAEMAAKASLSPGHGVDTGSMKRRTHVAEPGYPWAEDHVEPTENTAPLGNIIVLPSMMRGKIALELGCGQNYTI